MPTSSGPDTAATWFRDNRIAEANAPSRVNAHLAYALGEIELMDEHDSELRQLALVIYHSSKAVCIALDGRVR